MYPTLPTGAVFGAPGNDLRQGLAGQVAQAPQASNRGSPNIGRKRSKNPALLRATASPGHSTKLAQIFHHAQVALQHDRPPRSTPGRHPRQSRLPVLQRRTAGSPRVYVTEEENVGQNSFDETLFEEQNRLRFSVSDTGHRSRLKEPIGGNFGMKTKERSVNDELIVPRVVARDKVVTAESSPPELGTVTRDFDIWDDEDDSELYCARRSVALPTSLTSKELFSPGVDRSNVDKWLEDMLSASPRKKWRVPTIPGPDRDLRNRSPTAQDRGADQSVRQAYETVQLPSDGETSPAETHVESEDSDKENQKPSDERVVSKYFGMQPKGSLRVRESATPHKSRIPAPGEKQPQDQKSAAGSPLRFTHHATPRGYFLETPRRRKQASKSVPSIPLPELEEVVKLSPDVDPYRKATRPRRDRCASYYDEDIFVPPGKRGVLTESNMSRKLTRAMAFCEEAEDCEFTGVEARE